MLLRRAFALLLLSVIFVQCNKELNYVGGPDPEPVLPDPITAHVQGVVLDQTGQPLAAVTVTAGSQTSTTDARGYFRFNNASLDKKTSLVTAETAGYFKAFRSFSATSGTNQVVIKLIPKTLAGTVDAATGGTVTLTNGAKIALPANGIVKKSDNSSYSGTVNVYAAYIDPTASDIDQVIPGSLMANDRNGGRVTLTSYGMMAVELESSAAVKLQIKTGETATLTSPIPASIAGSAPSSIALWSINESTGIWNEDGSATRQGNVYVGTVKHFSFWNCDVSSTAVQLSMTLKNNNGDPLVNAHVRLVRQAGNGGQAHGWTDSLGQVSGLVPSNELLRLEVVDQCGNAFFTQNVGPFTQATNLGVITLTASSSANVVTITGQVLNCTNTPVTNGYARVYYGYLSSYCAVDATGHYTINFSTCSSSPATVDILAVDNATQQQGYSSAVAVVTPVTTANIIACGTSATQFINYTLNGTSYSIGVNASDSITGYTGATGSNVEHTFISGFQVLGSNNISFNVNDSLQVTGTFPMLGLRVQTFTQPVLNAGSTVTFTNFPTATGQFYEGTFTATFTPGTNTLSGSFRIRR